jgi:hypothetical protein
MAVQACPDPKIQDCEDDAPPPHQGDGASDGLSVQIARHLDGVFP